MKPCDIRTNVYKLIREKNLPVKIESQSPYEWSIVHEDFFINSFNSKEKAIDFCRDFGFIITAFIKYKNNIREYIE